MLIKSIIKYEDRLRQTLIIFLNIPVRGLRGLEGSRRLRLPDF